MYIYTLNSTVPELRRFNVGAVQTFERSIHAVNDAVGAFFF